MACYHRNAPGAPGDLYLTRSVHADILATLLPGRIGSLLAMLERGQDSALLRFSLGSDYLGADEHILAAEHLQRAVELDPNYSAAWKLYGKALAGDGRNDEAITAYQHGIEIAENKGDIQAAKEMKVFLKRLL